jgi:hypothetical protein
LTAHPDLYLFGSLVEAFGFSCSVGAAMVYKARCDELIEEVGPLDQAAQGGRGPLQIRTVGPVP